MSSAVTIYSEIHGQNDKPADVNRGRLIILLVELTGKIKHTKHIRNYLFIQEQRFLGRCSIIIANDGSGENLRLPRFTLQPLVENAFEHGLQPKEGSWHVEIRIKTIGTNIVIMIKFPGS